MKIWRSGKLWLFAGVMVCQFALFEAGLRLKGGSEAAPAFQKIFMTDPVVGYRLKPGARTRFKTQSFDTEIVINSSGTRDVEIGPKQPNEKRIVVLGDSLVLAVQVPLEQTFCKRLEDRLNRDPARGPYQYRVIDAGVQGYGPVQETLFYEQVASRFDADLVLMALYVGNDAIEAADAGWVLSGGRPPGAPTAQAAARETAAVWLRRIVRRSMVLQIVRMRAQLLTDRFRIGPRGPAMERPLVVFLPHPPPDVARGLDVTRQCVERVARFAAARGARTGVVLIPARFQVDDEDYSYMQKAAAEDGETLLRNGASERFKTALAPLPVPVMDALPPMFAESAREELYFPDTAHLTPRGHQVLADALHRFVVDRRLIDTSDVRRAVDGNR